MRYLEEESTYILSNFATGDTVTIAVYKLSDNSKVVDAVACSEIGTTGRFKYSFSQSISTKTEYLWVAENGTEEQQGKIILGGWPDDIYDRIGVPNGASIAVDIATRAPVSEYDTEMGYIPSNLSDIPTASELIAAHGSGGWTTADVSALASAVGLATHDAKLDTVQIDLTVLTDETTGRWKIINNQMIFYKADNITEVMRFNLFDVDGNPAEENVMERQRV